MFFKCFINDLIILDFYIVRKFIIGVLIGEKAIGVLVHRRICHRALGLSGILQSGFWFIGEFVIGVLVRRGFCYRAFDLSGFCYRTNGHRAFGYRPYVVYPQIRLLVSAAACRHVSPSNELNCQQQLLSCSQTLVECMRSNQSS